MVLAARLVEARAALTEAGISPRNAGFDADLLAGRVLGCDRAQLVARLPDELPAGFEEAFAPLLARRVRREPMAYILGEVEFWGLALEVTPDVLIPRPETELIVEEAIALYRSRPPAAIFDVCTGSGCLAIALATEFPLAAIVATDISEVALAVARRNASRHGVDGRIRFQQADFLTGVETRAELIVANPPYVLDGDKTGLMPEVGGYEPHVALFGGRDGLGAFRSLLPMAAARLEPGGRLIVEVGYAQDDAVTEIASAQGWRLLHPLHDLQGITRTLVFERT
jgi:release factor glutamine methyltransferase